MTDPEFACPRCAAAISHRTDTLDCDGCGAIYPIDRGIVDFRDTGRLPPFASVGHGKVG